MFHPLPCYLGSGDPISLIFNLLLEGIMGVGVLAVAESNTVCINTF